MIGIGSDWKMLIALELDSARRQVRGFATLLAFAAIATGLLTAWVDAGQSGIESASERQGTTAVVARMGDRS